jgi:predicted amidohydrolase
VGRDGAGLDYPGASALHDAFGEVIAKGDATEGLVVGDIDLSALRAWRERFPALKDRRPEIYSALKTKLATDKHGLTRIKTGEH